MLKSKKANDINEIVIEKDIIYLIIVFKDNNI